MAHTLDGARAKVRRASKRLRELNAEVRRFINEHPYAFRLEDNPDAGLPIYRVYALCVDEQPPEWLGVIVGVTAHNLRSALDHTVCQLARLNGATCRETQFSLSFSRRSFDYEEVRRLAGLTDRHRTMIRRVQPYHRRKGGAPLAILRELSKMDKRRVVNPATRAMTFVPPTVTPTNAVTRFTVEWGRTRSVCSPSVSLGYVRTLAGRFAKEF